MSEEATRTDRKLCVASSSNDDSLDFDGVMRLPLNFDDFDESLISFMPSSSCSSSSLLTVGAEDEKLPVGSYMSDGNIRPLSTSSTSTEVSLQYVSSVREGKSNVDEYHLLSSLGLTSLNFSDNSGSANMTPSMSW